jgi:hypothetical protein
MLSTKARSRAIFVALSVALVITACTSNADRRAEDRAAASARRAPGCRQLDRLVRRTARGHVPRRGPDIVPIPLQPTFIGGPSSPVHTGPWDHLAHVPLVAYGPGAVPKIGHIRRPATMADVAPTIARMIGSDFRTPDGDVLGRIVGDPASPPRLVVVVVWDGGGWNVLDEYENDWPFLRRMIRRGAGFDNFEIGSTPSNTPPIHATLGTGVFPHRHGIPGVRMRGPDGGNVNPFSGGVADRLEVPTLADLYDRDRGNRPLVGLVATKTWHLGMIGHGVRFPGADADTLVLLNKRGGLVGNPKVYEFGRLPDKSVLERASDALDRADGAADGRWKKGDLGDEGIRGASPAFVRFQQHVLEDTIVSQGFGRDETPDLLFTNFKQIDHAGHRWGAFSPQVGEAVAASDAALGRLERFLDRTVGRGRWAVLVTADHGLQPFPEDSGYWPVAPGPLKADVDEKFDDNDNGTDLVTRPSASGLFIDRRELRLLGVPMRDIADWLIDYRAEDNAKPGEPVPEAWADDPQQKLFAGIMVGKRLLADSCGR